MSDSDLVGSGATVAPGPDAEWLTHLGVSFRTGGGPWSPVGDTQTLPGVPVGIGPIVAEVHPVDDASGTDTSPGGVGDAEVVLATGTTYRLSAPAGSGVSGDGPPGGSPVVVAPLPELGSPNLGLALMRHDFPAVVETLGVDVVVVPVMADAEGYATRIFSGDAGLTGPPDLVVFSSAATYDRFVGGDSKRCFQVVHGAAVVEYLRDRLDQMTNLVIDPAGPSAVSIPGALLASFLEDIPLETGEDAVDDSPPTVEGLDLPLPTDWGVIRLGDESLMEANVRRLVDQQTRTLSDNAAGLRHDMRHWLTDSAQQAASAGGRLMGFLLTRHGDAGLALSVVTYVHDLGAPPTGVSLLEGITVRLAAQAAPGDALTRVHLGADTMLRQVRVKSGHPGVGGADVPLLLVDYWLAAPDGRQVGHVSFSSPHVAQKEIVTRLADNIVVNATWRVTTINQEASDVTTN